MSVHRRADRLLVERGLFASRARAQAAIAAGLVTADGATVRKASDQLPIHARLTAVPDHPWASRGGLKLAAALDHFRFDPAGRVCLDVGASTGGFTDVLLARGARRVYAVDVGHAQLHDRLRLRPEVVVLEATDVRVLDPSRLEPSPDFVVVDVSFISLKLVLPAALALVRRAGTLVALIKPQFEAGRQHLKKGFVRDEAVHAGILHTLGAFVSACGWQVEGIIKSPVLGGSGATEFLLGARRD
jgi:23S rRNA (cytidine1920-2'-O)/16S rRNA (cytidine1409-2'-O)-methyltransferase